MKLYRVLVIGSRTQRGQKNYPVTRYIVRADTKWEAINKARTYTGQWNPFVEDVLAMELTDDIIGNGSMSLTTKELETYRAGYADEEV